MWLLKETRQDLNLITTEVKGVKHRIFEDVEEFTMFYGGNPPPLVKDWRNGQVGDWVLADDGGIVQVLYRKNELPHPGDASKNGKYTYHQGYLRTIIAPFFINNNPNTKMDTNPKKHPSRFRFGGARVSDQRTRIVNRKTLTKPERVFIFNILHRRFNLEDAYADAYKNHTATGTRLLKKALLLVKQERIMAEMKKEVADAAGKLGITHEYVLEGIKDFSEHAEDERVRLDAKKTLGKAIQTFEPKEQKNASIVGYGASTEYLPADDTKLIDDVTPAPKSDEETTNIKKDG